MFSSFLLNLRVSNDLLDKLTTEVPILISNSITDNITSGYNVVKNISYDSVMTIMEYDYIWISLMFCILSGLVYSSYTLVKDYETKWKGIETTKAQVINKGTYLESILEVNNAGKEIISKFTKDASYWILLRVQLKNPITMKATKCDLHGNHVIGSTDTDFETKDMYLIIRFKIINEIPTDCLFGNVIVKFMNHLNFISDSQYQTKDFIVCAIGTALQMEPKELTNGLKNIRYELNNFKDINAVIPGTKNTINYQLMLPVHNIYDLFMDVYNNCIFESKQYVIDDDNYESWNNKSINELDF